MADHIFTQCVYARQVWYKCFGTTGVPAPIPQAADWLEDWWIYVTGLCWPQERKWLVSLVILVVWSLWKQRNTKVFGNIPQQYNEDEVASWIMKDVKLWSTAGAGVFHRIGRS